MPSRVLEVLGGPWNEAAHSTERGCRGGKKLSVMVKEGGRGVRSNPEVKAWEIEKFGEGKRWKGKCTMADTKGATNREEGYPALRKQGTRRHDIKKGTREGFSRREKIQAWRRG